MKITFDGHQKSQREVELTQQDLAQLFEIMKQEFETHIENYLTSGGGQKEVKL